MVEPFHMTMVLFIPVPYLKRIAQSSVRALLNLKVFLGVAGDDKLDIYIPSKKVLHR